MNESTGKQFQFNFSGKAISIQLWVGCALVRSPAPVSHSKLGQISGLRDFVPQLAGSFLYGKIIYIIRKGSKEYTIIYNRKEHFMHSTLGFRTDY